LIITSRENSVFKTAMLLKTAKGRSEKGMFIIEGVRSVRDALSKGADIFCIIQKEGTDLKIDTDKPTYIFAKKLFDTVCETVTPQGVMALCRMENKTFGDILKRGKELVVMCEALQDPGNIGTVIRTAHAVGAGGVILTKGCCDLYNPKIIRATMTGIFSVPVVSNVQSGDVIEYFKANGYKIVAGALTDSAVDFYDADLSGKHLIIVGNEGSGVRPETLSMCDAVLKIPMDSQAESLNAAVSLAVMSYEHYRQNTKKL